MKNIMQIIDLIYKYKIRKNIGILFEGTFDPPHKSHEKILKQCMAEVKACGGFIFVTTDIGLIPNVFVPHLDNVLRYTIYERGQHVRCRRKFYFRKCQQIHYDRE